MAKLKKTIKMSKPSEHYADYLSDCRYNRINCLEGAYRAGKSVINIVSFARNLEYSRDKVHLVTGASVASARLNISDCNGLGLSYIFNGRCRKSTYDGNECLRIRSKTGEKIVIFVGGGKSNSYKRIQGLSFGSWLSVELANLHIADDDTCFISMALSRLTQSKNQKIWWDLNPTYPTHKVYKKFLDKFELGVEGGYNFRKCSLFHNSSLSEQQLANALSLYPDTNSVEYRRYINGDRACADGIIFSLFATNRESVIIRDLDKFKSEHTIGRISIGVDFGGNGSDTTFVASAPFDNFKGVVIIASDKLLMKGGNSDSRAFREKFKDFVIYVQSLNFGYVGGCYGDSADPVMIAEMRNAIIELKQADRLKALKCNKATIKQRIDTKKLLMDNGRYVIYCKAETVIASTESQVWDSRVGHEDERLDNGSCDIDTADAEEYSWSTDMGKYLKQLSK